MSKAKRVSQKDLVKLGEWFAILELTLASWEVEYGRPPKEVAPIFALYDNRGKMMLLSVQRSKILKRFPEVKLMLELALSRLPSNGFDERDC